MPKAMDKPRVALVTGGSGPIGRAIAKAFASRGMKVAVAWHQNRIGALKTETVLKNMGASYAFIQSDLGSEAGPRRLVEETELRLGPVDVLVNAAGITSYTLTIDMGYDELRRVIDVNLTGAYLCAQQVLPMMMRRGFGRIINVGSIWGEVGAAGEVAYSAAKAGLSGLTKALAKEAASSGITVNAVAPGVIDTPMVGDFSKEERDALLARIPLGRMGTGDDVARAVSFLASDDASYVTGHVLWVTGGFDPLP